MKNILVVLGLLLPAFLKAQDLNKEVNELHQWIVQSEQVQLTDSVMHLVKLECQEKQIPDIMLQRNMAFLKILFNPAFDLKTRIRIADVILERFEETPGKLPLDLIRTTKRFLILNASK